MFLLIFIEYFIYNCIDNPMYDSMSVSCWKREIFDRNIERLSKTM